MGYPWSFVYILQNINNIATGVLFCFVFVSADNVQLKFGHYRMKHFDKEFHLKSATVNEMFMVLQFHENAN